MSRLKRFSSGLLSGYTVLGANVAFSLASVPLAFRYLSEAEFGLWALASQVALYIGLLDFGLSGAGMRILVDHKDDSEGTDYGGVIQTSLLVNFAHALLVVLGGVGAAFVIGPLLDVPVELQRQLRWLMIGQSILTASGHAVRTAPMVLAAHQRYNAVNVAQTLLFGLGLAVLWIAFRNGLGVFSLMWAQGVTQVLGAVVAVVACVRSKLLPERGRWGRPAWRWFWELFSFGRDMFLFSVGNLLINCSQSILITRVAGLEAVAVWSVCTRVFVLATQMVNRIFDYASAALAEMMVRGERDRLFSRFKSMVVLSASLSVVAGVTFAVSNQAFVRWLTAGKIGWAGVNDWLLAAWLLILVLVRNHTGLVGLTKEFRSMRYLSFFEGLFSVGLGWVALRYGGLTAMLVVFLLGSLFISFPYSTWRTSEYFRLAWRTAALGWLWPSFRLACALVPVGLVAGWLAKPWPPLVGLCMSGLAVGAIGVVLLLRWGIDHSLQKEIASRMAVASPRLRSWLLRGLTNRLNG